MSEEDWSKAQRLAVAGALAPRLRDQDGRSLRRVARVDAEGNVVGYTTLGEVQKALLRAREIELDVADGVRKKEFVCIICGRTASPKSRRGQVPKACPDGACMAKYKCPAPGCERIPLAEDYAPRRVARRNGRPWTCRDHRDPLPQTQTREQRAAAARAATAARIARGTPNGLAVMSPERRAEAHRKSWETRRANARASQETVPAVYRTLTNQPDNTDDADS